MPGAITTYFSVATKGYHFKQFLKNRTMKKENVFETDAPTIEMETQSVRRTQNGQVTPFSNGSTFNGFNGSGNQQGNTPYIQQNGYGTTNGVQIPQGIQQTGYYPTTPYGTYAAQWSPAPFNAFQQPFAFQQPHTYYAPIQQGYYPIANPAYIPTTPGFYNGTPINPSNIQPINTIQPIISGITTNPSTNGYQPAINLIDGQYTMVPQQSTQQSSKNGSPFSRHGERDFISWTPTVNILETDRAFKIEVCVPGVSRENCRVHIDKNNVLRITGTRRWNQETDAVGFTKKEFNYGSFACSFILSETMQREKITSSCRNGILIVSIPKREWNEVDTQTNTEISIN